MPTHVPPPSAPPPRARQTGGIGLFQLLGLGLLLMIVLFVLIVIVRSFFTAG
jgi:hypothetical protein